MMAERRIIRIPPRREADEAERRKAFVEKFMADCFESVRQLIEEG
jgi:hypothetical protein